LEDNLFFLDAAVSADMDSASENPNDFDVSLLRRNLELVSHSRSE
jgi:hypothetical protein